MGSRHSKQRSVYKIIINVFSLVIYIYIYSLVCHVSKDAVALGGWRHCRSKQYKSRWTSLYCISKRSLKLTQAGSCYRELLCAVLHSRAKYVTIMNYSKSTIEMLKELMLLYMIKARWMSKHLNKFSPRMLFFFMYVHVFMERWRLWVKGQIYFFTTMFT